MTKTIEIIVAPDGTSRVETKGFTGSECQASSQFVEQALGRSTEEQLKPEFYVQADAPQSVQQNNGS
jgi:hypothetical protein